MSDKQQKFGVDNLIKVIGFSLNFGQHLSNALADGKFKWFEAFGFIGEIMQIQDIAKSWPDIKNEVSELSAEELQQIETYINANFTVGNAKTVDIVNSCVDIIVDLLTVAKLFKAPKA